MLIAFIIVFAILLSFLWMLCDAVYASLPLCLYYLSLVLGVKIVNYLLFLCSLMHDLKYFLTVLCCRKIF